MKPDWKDAPEWVNWLVQEYTYDLYWLESKPVRDCGCWIGGGRREHAGIAPIEEPRLWARPDE